MATRGFNDQDDKSPRSLLRGIANYILERSRTIGNNFDVQPEVDDDIDSQKDPSETEEEEGTISKNCVVFLVIELL